MRARHAALAVALALLASPAATAKDFRPGDLHVCNHTRCVAITNAYVTRIFSSFYYGNRRVRVANNARVGAPAFELRVGTLVLGLAATGRFDRALVYGIYCERFRRGVWYRLPPRAAQELQAVATRLKPTRFTGFVPRSC
jgi:hypothetical protein